MNKNIVLVGFMGSGKSLTSRRLEEDLHCEVFSTDALIEERENRTITEIFKDSGEAYFRQVEKAVVKEVSQKKGIIIDCGGGVVLDSENIENLKGNGVIFYLSAPPERIYDNIKQQKHRPLLDVEDPEEKIRELLQVREPYYAQADIVIDADKPIEGIAQDILKVVSNE